MKLNRREFLQKSILTAGAATLLPSICFARQSASPRKIIIVGAGLAGLSAGYELTKLGHDVVILEAQNRIGGRVLTLREPFAENLYADAGASRIPHDHEITNAYVAEFNLPLAPFYPATGKFVRVKNEKPQAVGWDKFADATELVMELGEPQFWRKIKGGSDLLPKAFAAKLQNKIKLAAPVFKIFQDEKSVNVIFNEYGKLEKMSGDFLICAIPLTMLRKIEIAPAFSAPKQELIQTTKYESASRVFLQTRRRFWEDSKLNGFGFDEKIGEIWHVTFGQNGGRGILQTYLRGDVSTAMTALDADHRLKKTVEDLERFFPRCRENFENGVSKSWSEDAWVQGAWAHPGEKELEILKKPENRIFFAGEHTSVWSSWMHGALESGNRVVEEIKRAASLLV